MKKLLMVIMMLGIGACSVYSMEPPDDEALLLIAEAAWDPCTICAKQNLKKAFALLDKDLATGLEIDTDESCMFIKQGSGKSRDFSMSCYPTKALTASTGEGDILPDVVFTFHTETSHLVGIDKDDYTGPLIEQAYHESVPGTLFKARIKLIPYRYGDGPAYNYYRQSNTLQIHCTVLKMESQDKK